MGFCGLCASRETIGHMLGKYRINRSLLIQLRIMSYMIKDKRKYYKFSQNKKLKIWTSIWSVLHLCFLLFVPTLLQTSGGCFSVNDSRWTQPSYRKWHVMRYPGRRHGRRRRLSSFIYSEFRGVWLRWKQECDFPTAGIIIFNYYYILKSHPDWNNHVFMITVLTLPDCGCEVS